MLLAVAAPLAAWVAAGRFVASVEAAAWTETPLPLALAAGFGVSAAVGGAIVAALAPSASALDPQLAAAPIHPVVAALALSVVPAAAAAALLLAAMLPALARVAAAAPGGAVAAAVAAAGVAGCFVWGAALAEAALARFRAPNLAAIAGLTGAWLAVGVAANEPWLGPLAVIADALRLGTTWPALGLALFAVVAIALWCVAAATRADAHGRRRLRALPVGLPRCPVTAWSAAFARRLARGADVRRLVCVVVFAIGFGAWLMRTVLDLAAESVVALATGVAVLGASFLPVVSSARALDSPWLVATAPAGPRRLAAVSTAVAVAAAVALVAILVAPAAALLRAAPSAIELANVAAVNAAAAAAAGALVPWRDDRVGDQVVSAGAYLVIASLVALVLGYAQRFAPPAGTGAAVYAATASLLAVVAACLLSAALAPARVRS